MFYFNCNHDNKKIKNYFENKKKLEIIQKINKKKKLNKSWEYYIKSTKNTLNNHKYSIKYFKLLNISKINDNKNIINKNLNKNKKINKLNLLEEKLNKITEKYPQIKQENDNKEKKDKKERNEKKVFKSSFKNFINKNINKNTSKYLPKTSINRMKENKKDEKEDIKNENYESKKIINLQKTKTDTEKQKNIIISGGYSFNRKQIIDLKYFFMKLSNKNNYITLESILNRLEKI